MTTLPPDECGRPDFAGFAASLREEAQWQEQIHAGDRTGQAASDARTLTALAAYVERVGRRLGYDASPPPGSMSFREAFELEDLDAAPRPPDFQYTEDRETDFYREPIPGASSDGLHCSWCGAPGTTHHADCVALATGSPR